MRLTLVWRSAIRLPANIVIKERPPSSGTQTSRAGANATSITRAMTAKPTALEAVER